MTSAILAMLALVAWVIALGVVIEHRLYRRRNRAALGAVQGIVERWECLDPSGRFVCRGINPAHARYCGQCGTLRTANNSRWVSGPLAGKPAGLP
jgi:hypothetical protein